MYFDFVFHWPCSITKIILKEAFEAVGCLPAVLDRCVPVAL